MGDTRGVAPYVDPAPVLDVKDPEGVGGDVLEGLFEPLVYRGRTGEYVEGVFRAVEYPLRLVGVYMVYPLGQGRVIYLHYGQHIECGAVAYEGHGELPAVEILLYEGRLAVVLYNSADPGLQLFGAGYDGVVFYALARALVERFHDHGEVKVALWICRVVAHDGEARSWDAVARKELLCPGLVEAEPEGKRGGARVGDPEHLHHRRELGLPRLSPEALGHIEDHIGPHAPEPLVGVLVRLDKDDLLVAREYRLPSGLDGGEVVALGVKVLGEAVVGPAALFKIIGKPDPHGKMLFQTL